MKLILIKKRVSIFSEISIIKELDLLVDKGYYPSRSNLINNCIKISLPIIYKQLNDLNNNVIRNDLPKILDFLKERGYIIVKNNSRNKILLGNVHFNTDNQIIER